MTTDRELIEAAARAAGYPFRGWSGNVPLLEVDMSQPEPRIRCPKAWNPRENDGDSFRLAACLRITVEHNHASDNHPWVCASCDWSNETRKVQFMENVPEESQRADAMKLAILRCAAAQAPEVVE